MADALGSRQADVVPCERFFISPVLWVQLGKSLYAILGWVVISLTILTYSGTLRRRGEK